MYRRLGLNTYRTGLITTLLMLPVDFLISSNHYIMLYSSLRWSKISNGIILHSRLSWPNSNGLCISCLYSNFPRLRKTFGFPAGQVFVRPSCSARFKEGTLSVIYQCSQSLHWISIRLTWTATKPSNHGSPHHQFSFQQESCSRSNYSGPAIRGAAQMCRIFFLTGHLVGAL